MMTKELQAIWWEWLGDSERLLRTLHEQTAAVMLRDAGRVERLQPEIDRQIEHLREIDERAVACAQRLAETLGAEPTFRSLVAALPDAEAKEVHAVANRVKAASQSVGGVVAKNQALIENELAFVAGSLHLMARATEEKEGAFGTRTHAAVLLDETA
jgi:hypothetical protein